MHNIDRHAIWWQQDGAPATMQYLREQFPLRVMSKRLDWPWTPSSPDLAISDFFPWGSVKQQIWNVPHDQQPQNLEKLRNAIVAALRNLEQPMIRHSFDTMVSRARQCIRVRSHAISNTQIYLVCIL